MVSSIPQRLLLSAAIAALALLFLPKSVQAQVVWPFDGPFDLVEERNVADSVYSERLYDVSLETCVERFRSLVETQQQLAPRVYVAGLGFETTGEHWTVVVVREGREILPVTLADEDGRCLARFASEAWALRDADLRVALPDLRPFDALPIPVDGPVSP
ncbi:MAG: hypothetical protein ACI81R_003894 [Bradymonadia bacterium]|jgi:hypothetical protein